MIVSKPSDVYMPFASITKKSYDVTRMDLSFFEMVNPGIVRLLYNVGEFDMKKKGEVFVVHQNSLFLTRPRRMVITRQISSDLRQGSLLLLDQLRPFLAQGN